jgi:fatty-acyl-CoA synthase
VNNIPPSLSYRPADPAEPVLDISIGDALRAATSTWRTRTALIDGTSEEQTRRRWTFEELLTESEKVAQALLLPFRFRRTRCDLGGQWPAMGDD